MLRSFLDPDPYAILLTIPALPTHRLRPVSAWGPRSASLSKRAPLASYQLNNDVIFGNVGIGSGVSATARWPATGSSR